MARVSLTPLSLLLPLAALLSLVPLSLAKDVIIGDPKATDGSSWTHVGVNYTLWAAKNPLKIGDYVVFKYASKKHQVSALPDIASYIGCSYTKAKLLAKDTAGTGVGYRLKVTSKPQYIACMVFGHCEKGQKVIIVGK